MYFGWKYKLVKPRARSIQPKFQEISVQNSMDRFGPTGKVSKKTGPPSEVDHFSRSDRLEFLVEWIAPLLSTKMWFGQHRLLSVKTQQLNLESFLYKADVDGSSLLHMAVDSGNLKVS